MNRHLDTWSLHLYWFIALGERAIWIYTWSTCPLKLKLNWAELRQMRCSKLNKQSSLLGDSTMVIRVSCELPYIIYGCAVGCLQLNRPTVHWLGTLQGTDSSRGRGLKMALFPLEEVHFHLNEGGSPKRVVSRPCVWEMCWLWSKRLLCAAPLPCSRVIFTEPPIYTHQPFLVFLVTACSTWPHWQHTLWLFFSLSTAVAKYILNKCFWPRAYNTSPDISLVVH